VVYHSFLAGYRNVPPYTFTAGVSPVIGFSGCFSDYDLECKLSSRSTW
jgi:hypothetical protein